MAIVLNCPNCGKSISAPDSAGGKRGKCPHCGSPIQVPAAGGGDQDPFGSSLPPVSGGQNPFGGFANDEPDPAPRRRRRDEVDDDYEEDPRPRRRRRDDDDDDDDDDRPRRRRPRGGGRSRSSDEAAGNAALMWGVISLVLYFVVCGPFAAIFAFVALSKAKEAGDAPGASGGRICAWITIVFSILWVLVVGAVIIFFVVMAPGPDAFQQPPNGFQPPPGEW